MKKFLSLMLAMIMVMSLVTVGAGAAFTDDATIEQKEAVALLSGLGILEGTGDGSFNPNGTITRGAAAKILTYLLEGKAKAEAIKAAGVTETRFTDEGILNSSNIAFIEYCAQKGIVSGRSDGTFRRADGLTGQAYLKMVLTALGVTDIDFNTKTNPGWPIDASARAEKMGLLAGIDTEKVLMSDLLTRENACQIAFNALGYAPDADTYYTIVTDDAAETVVMKCDTQADAVMYAKLMGTGFKYGAKVTDKKDSLGVKVHNLGEYTGIVTKNGATNKNLAEAEETTVGAETFEFASDASMIGHKVTVFYNTKTDAVYAVLDLSTTVKLSNAAGDRAKLAKALDIKESEIENTYDAVVYDNTLNTTGTKTANAITVNQDKNSSNYTKATSGTVIIVYNEETEENEIIGFVKSTAKTLSKVTKIETAEGKKSIKLEGYANAFVNGNANVDDEIIDEIREYDGIAVGDIVVVTLNGEVYTLAKATTVTGTITKVNGTKVTMGGVEYSTTGTDKTTLSNKKTVGEVNFEDTYTLYLSGSSYMAIVKNTASSDVVFVVEEYTKTTTNAYGESETTTWAQCIDMNGAEVIYQLEESQGKNNELVKVTLTTKKGVQYATFAAPSATKYNDITLGADITSETVRIDAEGNYYFLADDVKFIAVDEQFKTVSGQQVSDLTKLEVTVKTGAQAVASGETLWVVATNVKDAEGAATKNYTVTTVFVDGAFDDEYVSLDDIVYAIESSDSTIKVPYVDAEGVAQVAYQHTVYIDGVKTTILVDNTNLEGFGATTSDDKLNGFVELSKVVDGIYTAKKITSAENLVDDGVIANVYKTKIDIENQPTLVAIDVADAAIYDLRSATWLSANEKTAITDAEDLYAGLNVSLILDKDAKGNDIIVAIYIVGKV